ncbi:MAG: hypothetical protein FD180_200 [Planctomycetota bacterium]|nr:MAG: hypothetical protein FD180_200 [Planctomycetota bacterium]
MKRPPSRVPDVKPPTDEDDRPEVKALFSNLKSSLPALSQLLEDCSSHGDYEDPVYRFYHASYKAYDVQHSTLRIVAALQALAPKRKLNSWFLQIVTEGTGKEFDPEHNQRWQAVVRPILEAFFHARFMLEMAMRYGRTLEHAPNMLPSGWAALLYLFNLR